MAGTPETEKYMYAFKRLTFSTHIVRRDTGEEVAMPEGAAEIYSYLLDQYKSYYKRHCDFFESLESIGLKHRGIERKTVRQRIRALEAIGLVKVTPCKKRQHQYMCNTYTVFDLEDNRVADNLIFYGPPSLSGGPLIEGMQIKPLPKKKPRGRQAAKNKPVEPDASLDDHIQKEEAAECPL